MTDAQALRIIEQLDTIIGLLQPMPAPVKDLLFRDVWPMVAHTYPIPKRIGNAIKWELLNNQPFYIEKYQYFTMEEFMTRLRLGEIFVRGLGPVSARVLYEIIKDFDADYQA